MLKILLSIFLACFASQALAADNYAATAGSGLTFGAKDAAGVLYSRFIGCDNTTVAQCWTVDASGRLATAVADSANVVEGAVADAAATAGSTGTFSAKFRLMTTQLATINTTLGTPLQAGGTVVLTAETTKVIGTVRIASGGVASGSYASGAFASGSFASGSVGSGAIASGAIASGAIAAGAQVDLLTMRGTVAGGTVAANSLLTGGQYNSTPITVTNTQQAALQLDANGYLKVNTAAGAAAGGTSSAYGAAFPANGTAIGYTDGTNMVAGKVGAVANVAAATNMVNSLGIAQYNATPLTVTDTRYQSLQSDVNGFLKVNVSNTNANGQATMANSSPIVIASNQTANALWGHGVTGSAVPANATYIGFNSGGNLTGPSITAPLPVNTTGPYPIGATPYTATATGTTAATTATLAGASSVTTYLCGFSIRANATGATTNNATVTGVITATLNFTQWTAPLASGLGVTEEIFSPCIPASGTNQSIAVVSGAPGSGGVISVTAWGYKL